MIRKILTLLAALLLMAAFYVLAVLADPATEKGASPFLVREDTDLGASVRFASGSQGELAGAFGAAVPRLPYDGQGKVENTSWRGIAARYYTFKTGHGTVSAVRPADAAPMLLLPGHALSLQNYQLLGMQASLASSGDSRCLYFAGDDSAYSFAAEGLSAEDFLQSAGELAF